MSEAEYEAIAVPVVIIGFALWLMYRGYRYRRKDD